MRILEISRYFTPKNSSRGSYSLLNKDKKLYRSDKKNLSAYEVPAEPEYDHPSGVETKFSCWCTPARKHPKRSTRESMEGRKSEEEQQNMQKQEETRKIKKRLESIQELKRQNSRLKFVLQNQILQGRIAKQQRDIESLMIKCKKKENEILEKTRLLQQLAGQNDMAQEKLLKSTNKLKELKELKKVNEAQSQRDQAETFKKKQQKKKASDVNIRANFEREVDNEHLKDYTKVPKADDTQTLLTIKGSSWVEEQGYPKDEDTQTLLDQTTKGSSLDNKQGYPKDDDTQTLLDPTTKGSSLDNKQGYPKDDNTQTLLDPTTKRSSLNEKQGCPKDDDMQPTRLDLTTKGSSVDEKLDDAQKNEEHNSTNEANFFEKKFLDSEYSIKKEVRDILKRFSWLSGAYGLKGPNKKIPRPHLYVTVKEGKKKSEVLKEIEEAFKCDPKKYFELFREPKIKPTFKYTSRPTSGGRIVAVSKDNDHNPLKVKDQSDYEGSRDLSATGTLTMFCFKDNNHYALTCFHAGCATEDQSFNQTFNLKQLVDIHKSLEGYKSHAEEKQKYFYQQQNNENTDENYNSVTRANPISLGTFSKCSFDTESDIMSIKVKRNTKIHCRIAEVNFPNWKNIWQEIYNRVINKGIVDRVTVQKYGFPANPEHTGHIVEHGYFHKFDDKTLFEDAIVVKGDFHTFLKHGDSGALICFFDESKKKQVFAYGVCEIDKLQKEQEMTSDEDGDSGSELTNEISSDEGLSTNNEECVGVKRCAKKDEDENNSHEKECSFFEQFNREDSGEKNFTFSDDEALSANIEIHSAECSAGTTGCVGEGGNKDNPGENECSDDLTEQFHRDDREDFTISDDERLSANIGMSEGCSGGATGCVRNDNLDEEASLSDNSVEVEFLEGPFAICFKLNTALKKLGLSDRGCFEECSCGNNADD